MHWTLHPITEFKNYRNDWNRLNESGPRSPLLNTDFIEPLLEVFGTRAERLAICICNGHVCAITVVTPAKFGAWMTFQPSQSPLGIWIHDTHLEYEPLVRNLRRRLPFPCIQMSVTQQDPNLYPRPTDTRRLKSLNYIQTARITIDKPFDEYWASRGKNLRQNLNRQRNRLAREDTVPELIQIMEPESIAEAVKNYGELESAGWKSTTGTAIHAGNQQGQFYRILLQRFCSKRQGVVFQYKYNSKIVATDLCVFNKQAIVILKTTYDESITTSSPAMLMRQDAFSSIFEQGITKSVEFYGKFMEWHSKWTDEIRNMYHLNYRIM